MGGVSDEDANNLKELFYQCDSDGDGGINIIELDITLQYLHQSLSTKQLKMLFIDVDLDNNGKISFSEFCILMGVDSESEREVADHGNVVEKSFEIFDTDNDGIISLDELNQMMKFLGLRHTELELTEMMNSVDVDDNGTIDLLEYQDLLAKTADAHSEKQSKLQQKFSHIDKDNSGLISFSELYFELSRGEEHITPLQVQAIFDTVDVDKNRRLDFEEFVKLTK